MTTVSPNNTSSELLNSSKSEKSEPLALGTPDKQLSFHLSQSSITSTSSDYVYSVLGATHLLQTCKRGRKGWTTGGSNLFSIQVCLVEDSEELIKVSIVLKPKNA